jgi:AcrR family transcriptional regulator
VLQVEGVPATRRNGRRPSDGDLLDGARSAFAELGFHGASMDVIAQRSGSTKPTLYAHFGDKETLYGRALDREASALEQHLAAAYTSVLDLPVSEQVRRDTMAFFEYAAAHPDGFELLFGRQASGPAHAAREALTTALQERMAAVFGHYAREHDLALGTSTRPLAALSVSVAIEAARLAIGAPDVDLPMAAELAVSYIDAALHHIDLTALQM